MTTVINKMLSPLGFDDNQNGGLIDFVAGVLLVILPWFFVSENNIRPLAGFMIAGSALILYAIFTDYRRGLLKAAVKGIQELTDLLMGVTLMALFPAKYSLAGVLLSFCGVVVLAGIYLW